MQETARQHRIRSFISACLLAVGLTSCSEAPDVDWTSPGFNAAETRYVPLEEINRNTVARLGLAWSLDISNENDFEATPLEIDGVLYFTGGTSRVYAVSVETGQLLWSYDPKFEDHMVEGRAFELPENRGMAYSDGAVFVATLDGRMISLDAKTGKENWQSAFLIRGDGTASTGAPRVCGDKIVIGNSGAEIGGRGYATALELATGKIAWRFFAVPGNPAVDKDQTTKIASHTWSGEWWKQGGGGTPWNALTCDAELGQFLIGTGNSWPYAFPPRMNGVQDNLFINSLVAVDLGTGGYKWHYQYNPGEGHDWKATMDISLAEMRFGGTLHKVAFQAPSNGFFYIIDRETGKVLAAKDYAKQNWTGGIDLETGRPIEKPGFYYGSQPITIYPGVFGSHNWQAMSVDTDQMLAYIPYIQIGTTYAIPGANRAYYGANLPPEPKDPEAEMFATADLFVDPNDPLDGRGALIAWDIRRQKITWQIDYPSWWNGGTMVTKGGLVFQGTEGGELIAYNSTTGERLWSFDVKHGIMAPPITYTHKGKQYVTVLAGYGGSGGYGGGVAALRRAAWKYGEQPRRILTFVLDGNADLPPTPPWTGLDSGEPITLPYLALDPRKVEAGKVKAFSCAGCHDMGGIGTGMAPDLRASPIAADLDALGAVLQDGMLLANGMPKYDRFTDDDVENIFQYLRSVARDEVRARGGPGAAR